MPVWVCAGLEALSTICGRLVLRPLDLRACGVSVSVGVRRCVLSGVVMGHLEPSLPANKVIPPSQDVVSSGCVGGVQCRTLSVRVSPIATRLTVGSNSTFRPSFFASFSLSSSHSTPTPRECLPPVLVH